MSTEELEETEKELSFNDISLVTDRKIQRLDVPAWKGYIYISAWTGKQRSAFEEAAMKLNETKKGLKGVENLYARLLLWGVCNKDGSQAFTEEEAKQILATKSSKVINDIIEEIKKLNGISEQDIDDISGN